MPKVVQATWGGDPAGPTRSSRRPCTYGAYVPDPLRDWDVPLPVTLAADMADAEEAVRQLNTDADVAHNLEPLARFLLRAEAVASSHIEGLVLNVRRLARSEADAREDGDHRTPRQRQCLATSVRSIGPSPLHLIPRPR